MHGCVAFSGKGLELGCAGTERRYCQLAGCITANLKVNRGQRKLEKQWAKRRVYSGPFSACFNHILVSRLGNQGNSLSV